MEFLGFSRRILSLQSLRQAQRYGNVRNIASDARDLVLESVKGSEGGQFVEDVLGQAQRTLASLGIKSKRDQKKSRKTESGKSEAKANHYFVRYEQGLFKRLDAIISLLAKLIVPLPKEKNEETTAPGIRRVVPIAAATGGLAGLAALAFFGDARHAVEYIAAGIGGSAIARRIRARFSRPRTNIRTTTTPRINTRSGRIAAFTRRIASMTEPVRRGAERVGGYIIARLGGLGRLLSLLRSVARRIPVLMTLLVPIQEAIESNEEIRELNRRFEAGEITEDDMRQQATESVIQAILNTVGTLGGGIVGGLLGAGVGSILTGAAGAWAGHELAEWVGGMIAPPIARAINSTNVDQIFRTISDALTGRVPVRELLQGHLPDDVIDRIVASYEATQQVVRAAGNAWNWASTQGTNLFNNAVRATSDFVSPPEAERAAATPAPAPSQAPVASPTPRRMDTAAISEPPPETDVGTTNIIISAPTTNVARNTIVLTRRVVPYSPVAINHAARYA